MTDSRNSRNGRLERAKDSLAASIIEIGAHFDDFDEEFLVGPLFGIGLRAAELAAIMGISTPPIEHKLLKPEDVERVVGSPIYPAISGIRVNMPDDDYFFTVELGPPGCVDKSAIASKAVSKWAKRWERFLDRLVLNEVQYSPLYIREGIESVEAVIYNVQLHHEIMAKSFSASEEVKLCRPAVLNKLNEQALEARRAALDAPVQPTPQDKRPDRPAMTREEANKKIRELLGDCPIRS